MASSQPRMRAWQLSCAPPSRTEVCDASVPSSSLSARQSPPLVRVSGSLDCLAMCSSSLSLPLSAFLSLSACLSLPLTPSWCLSLPPSLSVSLPPLRQRGSNEPHPGPRGPLETLVHCLHRPPLPFPLPGSPYVVQRTIFALEFTFNSRITGCTEHIRAERRVGRGPAHPCCCRWTLWSPGSFLGTQGSVFR